MIEKMMKLIKAKSAPAPEPIPDPRVAEITKEFEEGLKLLRNYPKSATFFGSSKSGESDFYYQKARELAGRLAKELGYSIISGGGPGIMEAADRGAYEVHGDAVGLQISLPDGQPTNSYVSEGHGFYYFFIRKFCLAYGAEIFIFFPGGFGTLDEFFEIVTLIQTKKMTGSKIVCFGSEYWNTLKGFMTNELLEHGMIAPGDEELFTVTDSLDEIVEIARGIKVMGDVPFSTPAA